jgi:hypothetical protein
LKAQVLFFPHDIGTIRARHGAARKGMIGPDFGQWGFWRMELDSGLVFATAGLFHIFGLEPREGPANVVQMCERIHPDDLPRLMKTFEDAGSTKLNYSCTFRVRRSPGRYKTVLSEGMFQPLCGQSGAITGMTYEIACEQPPVGTHS